MIKFVCGNCGSETIVNEPTFNGVVSSNNSTMKTVNLNPNVVKHNNKENKMTKLDERMLKLKEAGLDVSKFEKQFGAMDLNTMLTQCFEDDPIAEEIIKNGYVRNTKLHRRYIMAMTMRLLGNDNKWTERVHSWYGFDYQFTMMLEELRILAILEKEDKETFVERAHFFTRDVVVATCENYLKQFIKYVKRAKMCENRKYGKYKRIFGKYYQINDIPNLYNYIEAEMCGVMRANTVTELYEALKKFMNSDAYHKLPWDYDKSQIWLDAFKGAGSYYTLKNMIMYHNCLIFDETNKPMTQSQSMEHLEKVLDEYKGQYWRMLALLKKVISDNNFSWKASMDKVYNK